MHRYSGTSTEFIASATRNRITKRLREGFFRHYGYSPPESEVRSRRNLLMAMAAAVELALSACAVTGPTPRRRRADPVGRHVP